MARHAQGAGCEIRQGRIAVEPSRNACGAGEPKLAFPVLTSMIKLAIMCLVVAAIAAILGFGGLAGAFVDIAMWLAIIGAVLFVVFLLIGLFAGKKAKDALD